MKVKYYLDSRLCNEIAVKAGIKRIFRGEN